MITASIARRRSRMLVALLAVTVGATILAGLVMVYYDMPRQMGEQFLAYGANMIFVPSAESEGMTEEEIDDAIVTSLRPSTMRPSSLRAATSRRR